MGTRIGCPEKSFAVCSSSPEAAASDPASAAPPAAFFLPASAVRRADAAAVAQASSPAEAYAAAADARSAEDSAAGAKPRCAAAPDEYSAQDGSLAPPDSVLDDSPQAGCWTEAHSVPAGSADYSAALADDHSAAAARSAGSAPDDCSPAVDSAVAGLSEEYSAAPPVDDRSAPAARSADSVPDDYSPAVGLVPVDSAAAGSPDYSVAPDSSHVHSRPADFLDGFPADFRVGFLVDFPADFPVGSEAVHSPADLQDGPEAMPPACSPSPPAPAPVGRARWLAAVSASPAVARTAPGAEPEPAASLRTMAAVAEEPSSRSLAGSPLPPEEQPRVLPCWSGLRVPPLVQAQPPLANSSGPTPVAADPPVRLHDLPAVP